MKPENFDRQNFDRLPVAGWAVIFHFGPDQIGPERVRTGNASRTPPEATGRKEKQKGYTDIPRTLKALRTQEKPRQRGRGLLCLIMAVAFAFPMSAGRFPDAEERK